MAAGYRSGAGIAAASSLALLAADAGAGAIAATPAADQPPADRAPANRAPADQRAPASASPAPIWQDLTALGVTCLVHTPRGVDTGALHDRLCAAVTTRAAKGAPVPVTATPLGGAALAPGRVTLLVQATVAPVNGADVIALTLRPFRNITGSGQFFAAAPRLVAAGDAAALDAAVAALLAETLPWQATHRGRGRPLPGAPPHA
ncbi:hypothetical protein F4693_002238 [Sphingomonas endophytica]|uniref:Uncharacterized protein n=1 Tax=Sphingomonas endophytica TaxID=869719 RepID=A0A7X0MPN6_9SPHN|nr:hypothetical protein [Sphingomonas endophytica]MBB6505250.1 hypothetical protein [Sphingomonas endophytica]